MLKTCIALLLIVVSMGSSWAHGASYYRVDRPELDGTVLLVADLYDTQEPQVVLGRHSGVHIVADGEGRQIIGDLPGTVTALAAGDLTGDFRPELLVGTDNAGAFYIYEHRDGKWLRVGRARYLWEPISYLAVHDINNDGWGDVLALNRLGEAEVFLSWEGELYSFWRASGVRHFRAADIDQDGVDEIIFTRAQGHIGILKWTDQQLEILWENYPWGTIESFFVVEDGPMPEWVVVTSQKMLYGWRWQNGQVSSTRHFHAPLLGEFLTYIPGAGVLSFARSRGASMLQVQAGGVQELWNVPDVWGEQVYPLQDSFLVRDSSYNYFLLAPSDGRWQVFRGEENITDEFELVWQDGLMFTEVGRAATSLGLSLFGTDPLYIIGNNGFVRTALGDAGAVRDGLTFPLPGAPFSADDSLYVPVEVFNLVGYRVDVDQARQQVRFMPHWGWWY
ncbi:MAG TPA: VCBS repeat-containing protein [Firmicutes bacterium]|nr:MAG: hypothetical protein AA931_02675 [Peptococcaceae bacterium 1109]HHT72583.1 VCBS repeat-containing protein [Bacillota bacterium]